jgi:hypothetical protein
LNFNQITAAARIIEMKKYQLIIGGTTYLRITRSVGVLAFTWSLIAIVIVNTYNCSVISHLSANYRKPEVSTFKELAANNDYNMVTVKGSIGEVDVIVSAILLIAIFITFLPFLP